MVRYVLIKGFVLSTNILIWVWIAPKCLVIKKGVDSANIYLFNSPIETLEKGVKYVQN